MSCFLYVGIKNNSKVTLVEKTLKRMGYYLGKEDGYFGPVLRKAVILFQEKNKIVVDGCVGKQTWSALGLGSIKANPVVIPSHVTSTWQTVQIYKLTRQPDGVTCGPSSTAMALSEFKIEADVQTLRKIEETSLKGTDHNGIHRGILAECKEHNVNAKAYDKGFKEVGWKELGALVADPKVTVICHVNTKYLPTYYQGSYGHYVFPIGVNITENICRIADPARGVCQYKLAEFTNGMYGVSQPSLIIAEKV